MERSTRNLWRFSSLVAREMGRGTRYLPCGFRGNKGRTRRKKKKMSLSTTQRFPSPLSTFVPRLRILRADFSLFSPLPFSRQLASFPKASFVETYQFSQFSWKKRRIEGSRRNVVGRRTRNNREKDRRCGGGRNGIPMEGA